MGAGFGCAEAGEGRLEDEEGRADKDPHEDEEEALLSKEVMEGAGEGSRVLDDFR